MIGIPRGVDKLRAILYLLVFSTIFGLGNLCAADVTSQDAYARYDQASATWTIGTASVEEKLRFAAGAYSLISFRNKVSGRQYVTAARAAEEFRITLNDEVYTGTKGGWQWKGGDVKVLSQGELLLGCSPGEHPAAGGKKLPGLSRHRHHPAMDAI